MKFSPFLLVCFFCFLICVEGQAPSKNARPNHWPEELWNKCWNGKWVDFTFKEWNALNSETQQKYTNSYQQWYAKEILKSPFEKKILINTIAFELILIPPGQYWKGSPVDEGGRDAKDETQQKVLLASPFWCGKYEVTWQQWSLYQKPLPSKERLKPVEEVSWSDCEKFCQKTGFRFLTEEEWEYCCRSGTTTAYFFGENFKLLNDYASYYDNSAQLKKVGQKKPNGFGLFDMHGNIWEWCQNWYLPENETRSKNALTASQKTEKVYRGGGWDATADGCRSAERGGLPVDYRNIFLGFRIALSYEE